MGADSKISWTGNTWNPWWGCTKVSPGCENCYMFLDMARFGRDPANVQRTSLHTFNSPLCWQRKAQKGELTGRERLVFTCSMSDFFHPDADPWREDAWAIIRKCPDLIFQILTKRPERFKECLPKDWCDGYRNCWLGVTAENQHWADMRIPILIDTPAALRFASMEPLLGPVDFTCASADPDHDTGGPYSMLDCGISWVIAGGESGPKARPCNIEWLRSIRDQCKVSGVACFIKQFGRKCHMSRDEAALPVCHGGGWDADGPGADAGIVTMEDPRGANPSEWPEDLRVQQMPPWPGL